MASGSPSSSPDTATGSGTDPARPDTGEPLGGAGSDSDSDLGLGKFDCSAMEMGDRLEGDELEREFESAADRVRDLIQTASRDQLLYLYARYKQVSVDLCMPKSTFILSPSPCVSDLDSCHWLSRLYHPIICISSS